MTLDDRIAELVRAAVREEVQPLRDELAALKSGAVPADAILTVAQAAKEAQLKPATIRAWIKDRRLVAGTRPFRIRRRDLLACLAKRAAPAEDVDVEEALTQKVRHLRGG